VINSASRHGLDAVADGGREWYDTSPLSLVGSLVSGATASSAEDHGETTAVDEVARDVNDDQDDDENDHGNADDRRHSQRQHGTCPSTVGFRLYRHTIFTSHSQHRSFNRTRQMAPVCATSNTRFRRPARVLPPKRYLNRFSRFCSAHGRDQQTDRQTDIQVIWHDASRSQWQEYALEIGEILHIFPSGTQSMGDRGSKKAYTGPRTAIYLPTKFGFDRSIVVGCRSWNDRQTDRQTEWNDNKAHSLRT